MKLPLVGSRPYRIWNGVKSRCRNKNLKNYGGKGVSYDPKWEKFAGFWGEMSKGYSDNLSIDRIDSNGNYTKKNCRWATSKEQMRNFKGNTRFTHKGKTMILSDWATRLGITKQTLIQRVYKLKEPIEYALSRGRSTKFHKDTVFIRKEEAFRMLKEGKSQVKIAKELGVTQGAISKMIKREQIK